MSFVVTYRAANWSGVPIPHESSGPVNLTRDGNSLMARPYDSQHGDGSLGQNFLADDSDASWIDLVSVEGIDPSIQYTWIGTHFDAQTLDLANATAFEFRARISLDDPSGPAPVFTLVAYDGSMDPSVSHDLDEDVTKIQWASDVSTGTSSSPVEVGGQFDTTDTHARGQYLADILGAGNLHMGIAIGGDRAATVHVYELFLRVTYDDVFPTTTGDILVSQTPIVSTNDTALDPTVVGTNDGTVLTDDSPDTFVQLAIDDFAAFTQIKVFQSAPTIRDDSPVQVFMVLEDLGTRGNTNFLWNLYYDDPDGGLSSWHLQYQFSIAQDGIYHVVEYLLQPGDPDTDLVTFPGDVYDHSQVVQRIRDGSMYAVAQVNESTETVAALYTMQLWVTGSTANPLRLYPRPNAARLYPPQQTRQRGLRTGGPVIP